MGQPFLGMIATFPYNFAPQGWAFCAGQLMPINQNTALFSLLGTTYGGDGVSNFALPDLRGRVGVSSGQGPGLSNYDLGELSGVESVTLITSQIPSHTHTPQASSLGATDPDPTGRVLAKEPTGTSAFYHSSASLVPMDPSGNGLTGGSQPHENRQPLLVLNFCIALQGIFPSRS